LANFREAEELTLRFQKEHDLAATAKLSEIAAYCMLRSPSFKELLTKIARLTGEYDLDAPDFPEQLGRLVLGEVVSHDSPLLQELISGPFDADKLDYLTRDAVMCGIPAALDVPRLIQKIRAVRVTQGQLPPDFARR